MLGQTTKTTNPSNLNLLVSTLNKIHDPAGESRLILGWVYIALTEM